MIILGNGKARIRKTGEEIYVVGYKGEQDKRRKTDWVSYIDSKGVEHEMVKEMNPYWDLLEYRERSHIEFEREVERWVSTFAGLAMHSLIRTVNPERLLRENGKELIVAKSVEYGEALCIELGKKDISELAKKCYPKDDKEENN